MLSRNFKCYCFAASVQGKPFKWGRTNCVMLAARLYDKLEGGKFWRKQVMNVLSEQQALKLCKSKPVYNAMVSNGFKQVKAKNMRLGDLIYVYADGLERLHIYYGEACLSSTAADGVVMLNTAEVVNYKNAICLSKGS